MEKRKSESSEEISKKLKKGDDKNEFASTVGYIFPSDTELMLRDFRKKFPVIKFVNKIPPLIFVHQLFNRANVIPSKIYADIAALIKAGTIKQMKIGPELDVVFFVEDLKDVVYSSLNPSGRPKFFLNKVLPSLDSYLVEKSTLKNDFKLSEKDITDLVQFGLLAVDKESTYNITFPALGQFMKTFYDGRNALVSTIRKSKYRELLVSEIKGRALKPLETLGLDYHLADVIGAKLLTSVDTTSGPLLRLAT